LVDWIIFLIFVSQSKTNIMLKTISLQEYAKRIGYIETKNLTLEDIQEFAEEVLDWTIWDYPIEELDYVINEVHEGNTNELVYVETDFGLRICEL
jgi:hypothetical protein